MIATANTIELIETQNIQYVEAYANYSKVYNTDKSMLLSRDSLAELDKHMGFSFYRIHNSYIINLNQVKRYHRSGEVELQNGIKLPVARRRRTEFIESLTRTVAGMNERVVA